MAAKRLPIVIGLILLGGAVVASIYFPRREADNALPPPVVAPRSPRLDDSGFGAVKMFAQRISDPLSLKNIRDSYAGAGLRGTQALERELNETSFPPPMLLDKLTALAQLYLYDGRFAEAEAALTKARTLIEANKASLGGRLPTLIFLQGMAALRRGETENCVECQCESSCIFPIQASAVHQKRAGSADAIKFFKEYIQICPDDVGVRWLLSVAAMTLGEYPDAVPIEYRLPLERFNSEVPMVRFVDVAAKVGVNRLHQAGGAIMDDFDNDGLLDLVETTWDATNHMAFFRNKGDGTFEDRTEAAGLKDQLGGLNCMQTDYNNDGFLDIFICRGAWTGVPMRPTLLRNNGNGTFTDVTREAGLIAPLDTQTASWADYDNDGWLDLFIGGETVRSRLYHNRRDGTFEEVAVKAGVANEQGMCKGCNWGDYNGDGFPDLYVSNLNGANRLYRNNKDGTFTDVAFLMGVTKPDISFSCWFWDYDNDGKLDILANSYDPTLTAVIQNMLRLPHNAETTHLYRNLGDRFEDVSVATGTNVAAAPMGSNFADFDGDGFLDFYLSTGDPKYSMLVPNRMFKNIDGKRFVDVTEASGTGHLQKGHGVACGDWDRNGSIDLFLQLGGATPGDAFRNVLFQNPGAGNRWITIKLVGVKTNRAAIGARIKITTAEPNPRTIYRHVTCGSSFGANPLQQTIGIGKADRIGSMEVYWPTSGTTQIFRNVNINQAIEITEGKEAYRRLEWKPISTSNK